MIREYLTPAAVWLAGRRKVSAMSAIMPAAVPRVTRKNSFTASYRQRRV